jgi:hypothetical protein
MKVQFEIKEKMPDIIAEILFSDKWCSVVKDDSFGMKRVIIKNSTLDSEPTAFIEIWEQEIHIKIAKKNYNYRIFHKEDRVTCEYIGLFQELFNQNFPLKLTPVMSIYYSSDDNENFEYRTNDLSLGHEQGSNRKHFDEFICDDMPVPTLSLTNNSPLAVYY